MERFSITNFATLKYTYTFALQNQAKALKNLRPIFHSSLAMQRQCGTIAVAFIEAMRYFLHKRVL